MPQFGLGARDHLVGLRQLLNVAGAGHQRVMKDLNRADLQHAQNDLRILRIVLVPAVVQRLPRPGECHGRDQLQLETRRPECEHQRPVVVPRRLEPDRDRQFETPQDIDQASIVVGRVQNSHPAAACLVGDSDQHLVAVLGNVDAYQNSGIRSMLSLGHSRSPLWCGPQNHHRDPSPGYGRLARAI
jgi:hypothetical protein